LVWNYLIGYKCLLREQTQKKCQITNVVAEKLKIVMVIVMAHTAAKQ
jgi:hypothetical protein